MFFFLKKDFQIATMNVVAKIHFVIHTKMTFMKNPILTGLRISRYVGGHARLKLRIRY